MTLPFNHRLNIGEDIERITANYIVKNLNADVEKIGALDDATSVKPLTWRNIEGTVRRIISPDLNVYKDDEYYSVQVKHKASVIHADSTLGKQCFYFDVKEHTRLSRLNRTRPCILLIHCPALPQISETNPTIGSYPDPFIFVDMATLEPDQTQLKRRTINGTDTFVLPLKLFNPLKELFDRKVINEPANKNSSPATIRRRGIDYSRDIAST
jgi:hypothetical protein